MTESVAVPQASEKLPRPTVVWIGTIYALISAGLVPLLVLVYFLISGLATGNEINFLLSLPINLGVIISAVGAWKGSERARKALLFFITLHYGLVGLNNFLLLISGHLPDEALSRTLGRSLRGLVYPAVYIWYFNKKTTKEFYK